MGDQDAASGGRLDAVQAALRGKDVETAHVGIFDLDATFRERRLGVSDLASVFEGGTFVNVLPRWDIADRVFAPGPFVGEPVALDPASLRPYPFEPKAVLLVADYLGESAALSPRELLRSQVERAEAMGFAVRAAFEFEFIVLQETAQSLREKGYERLTPFALDNRCWAGESAATHGDFIAELDRLLRRAELPLYSLGLELGPGCLEATLRATDPLRAADDAALFRLFTKAFCRRRDLTASFMAQLGADFPGLSGHLHLSLVERRSARNAFFDAGRDDGLSALCHSFIGGMTELIPEALALSAHTVNAYRRLTPGNWAPHTASWAIQNYAAAIRAVPAPEAQCRLEFRLPASDTNPFLTLALMLGAGLSGVENKTQPVPPMAGGGPDETPAGVPTLPHDLFEATKRLDRSRTAREIFGDSFIDHFVTSRRAEETEMRRQVSARERARYLEAI